MQPFQVFQYLITAKQPPHNEDSGLPGDGGWGEGGQVPYLATYSTE